MTAESIDSPCRLIVVSAGDLGREIYHLALQFAACEPARFVCGGFLDDRQDPLRGTQLADVPIIGSIESHQIMPDDRFILALGSPNERVRFAQRLDERDARYARIVSPTARIVTPMERIGTGTVFDAGAQVSCDVDIGRHSFIGVHTTIGHDCVLGDACHIGAGVFVGGDVIIGNQVTIRSNASIGPGVHIEDGATVGPNSVVLRRVRAGTTVFGAPAKVVTV